LTKKSGNVLLLKKERYHGWVLHKVSRLKKDKCIFTNS